jgi:cytoskeleton protein RodZ
LTGLGAESKLLSSGGLPLSAETPQEFGEELRRERELRDVSREHLAAAIRISIRQLDALESGRFEILPAKVFSRGFVRAIAIHLGLDAEHYAAAFASVWDGWAETERHRTSSDRVQSGQHVRLSKPRRAASMSTFLVGGGIALAIALVTFGAVFLKSRAERPSPHPSARSRAERTTVPSTGPASLALPPSIASSTVALQPSSALPSPQVPAPVTVPVIAAPSPAERPPAAPPAPREGLVLTMTFRDDCWTEVSADGRPVAAELFRKGVVKEFAGSRKFVLTLGNAGAVNVSLNGAPVPIDGSSGKVVKNLVLDQSTTRSRPFPG